MADTSGVEEQLPVPTVTVSAPPAWSPWWSTMSSSSSGSIQIQALGRGRSQGKAEEYSSADTDHLLLQDALLQAEGAEGPWGQCGPACRDRGEQHGDGGD